MCAYISDHLSDRLKEGARFVKMSNLAQAAGTAAFNLRLWSRFAVADGLALTSGLQGEFGVSRSVVREAIKWLVARGLVSTSSGQSAVVGTDFTRPAADALLLAFHHARVHIEDLLAIRALLEPEIAALAATNATVS